MAEKKKEAVQAGMTIPKSNFSEWFSEIVAKAELADLRYNVKGFLVHRPMSVLAMKAMYRAYEKELESKGHKPVWFPALIPVSNLQKEAEHVEGFAPELFTVEKVGNTPLPEKLVMRPTSETAFSPMFAVWTRSWRDLPMKLYHPSQVWRYETKATRPFIRGREFHWIETHNIFATEKDAMAQVKEDMETTEKVMHRQFGIPFIFFKRPQWDKFAGAVNTYAADTLMPDGKILQQPSTHMLGQNFSKPFNIKFEDRDGKEKHVWQTCYGPCIWRIFASLIAHHGDDKGLVFPFEIASVQVVIIPVGQDRQVEQKCRKLLDMLVKEGYRTELDNSERTPGWKFNEWEMRGVPIRIEVGPKELKEGKLTLARRDTSTKQQIAEAKLLEKIPEIGRAITENLVKKADAGFGKSVQSAKTMEELKERVKKGGFVKINFCTDQMGGLGCAEKLKETLHVHVRGTRADVQEKPSGNCLVCGKKSNAVVYVGKQY